MGEIVGFLGGLPVYKLSVHVNIYQRLMELSREGLPGLPDWLSLGQATVRDQRLVLTSDPEWFRTYFREGVEYAER